MRGDPRKGYVHYMDTGGARQGEERGRGTPRTNEERAARHERLYPGEPLPEKGTGLSGGAGTIGTAMLLGLAVVVVIAVMGACKKK